MHLGTTTKIVDTRFWMKKARPHLCIYFQISGTKFNYLRSMRNWLILYGKKKKTRNSIVPLPLWSIKLHCRHFPEKKYVLYMFPDNLMSQIQSQGVVFVFPCQIIFTLPKSVFIKSKIQLESITWKIHTISIERADLNYETGICQKELISLGKKKHTYSL